MKVEYGDDGSFSITELAKATEDDFNRLHGILNDLLREGCKWHLHDEVKEHGINVEDMGNDEDIEISQFGVEKGELYIYTMPLDVINVDNCENILEIGYSDSTLCFSIQCDEVYSRKMCLTRNRS